MTYDERYAYALRRNKGYWRGIIVCASISGITGLCGLFGAGSKIGDICCTIFMLEILLAVIYFILLVMNFCSKLDSGHTPDVEHYQEEVRRGMHHENSFTGF